MPYCLYCDCDLTGTKWQCPNCYRPYIPDDFRTFHLKSKDERNRHNRKLVIITVSILIVGVAVSALLDKNFGFLIVLLATIRLLSLPLIRFNDKLDISYSKTQTEDYTPEQADYDLSATIANWLNRPAGQIHFVRLLLSVAGNFISRESAGQIVKANDQDQEPDKSKTTIHFSAGELCDAVRPLLEDAMGDKTDDYLREINLIRSDDLGKVIEDLIKLELAVASPEDDPNDFIGYCRFVEDKN